MLESSTGPAKLSNILIMTIATLGHLHLFVQRHFIASKLNTGCDGYLDKIYKILVDILALKAGFPLANFFIRSDFFRTKTIKTRIGSYFFYFDKSREPMRIK